MATFEPTRQVVFARELSKMFEEVHRCALGEALAWVKADQHRERGEFVVLVEGATLATDAQDEEAERILKGVRGVSFNYFTSKDVVRHPLVARIIEAYEKDDPSSV